MEGTRERWAELVNLSVLELVALVVKLEGDRDRLARLVDEAARMPMCGSVIDAEHSCQLMRGHEGLHAWAYPDEDTVVRWG